MEDEVFVLQKKEGVSLNAFVEAASHDCTHQWPPFSQARHSVFLSLSHDLVCLSQLGFSFSISLIYLLPPPRTASSNAQALDDIMVLKRSAPSPVFTPLLILHAHSSSLTLSLCFLSLSSLLGRGYQGEQNP